MNWAASRWHARLDFTNEKRFTIGAPTQKLLRKLNQPVTITVLLKGNYPSAFRQLASSTDDMLREFREYAGNKIQFRFVSPDETMAGQPGTYADTLASMGVYPINLTTQLKEGQQQQFVYPVALVQAGERLLPVVLYQGKSPMISIQELNSAEAMLELIGRHRPAMLVTWKPHQRRWRRHWACSAGKTAVTPARNSSAHLQQLPPI